MASRDIEGVWEEIRFFESRETLRQLAAERLGFRMNATQADDILACLQLARDYFAVSKMAGLTIKPLPLFYGMANLVKGLTILCGGKERNSSEKLPGGHGLKMLGNSKALENLSCRVEKRGTFADFLDTFRTDIRFQFPNVFDARLRSAGSSELAGQEFLLGELLGCDLPGFFGPVITGKQRSSDAP
jgi:hypothetical protein